MIRVEPGCVYITCGDCGIEMPVRVDLDVKFEFDEIGLLDVSVAVGAVDATSTWNHQAKHMDPFIEEENDDSEREGN